MIDETTERMYGRRQTVSISSQPFSFMLIARRLERYALDDLTLEAAAYPPPP